MRIKILLTLCFSVLCYSSKSFATLEDLELTYNKARMSFGFFGKSWCSALDKSIEITSTAVLLFNCESEEPVPFPRPTKLGEKIQLFYKGSRLLFNSSGMLLKIQDSKGRVSLINYDEFDRPISVESSQGRIQIEYDSKSTFASQMNFKGKSLTLANMETGS
jgi:hypothetical protein